MVNHLSWTVSNNLPTDSKLRSLYIRKDFPGAKQVLLLLFVSSPQKSANYPKATGQMPSCL